MRFFKSLCVLITVALVACVNNTNGKLDKHHLNVTVRKPNVIMIVVDDLGWNDIGYNQTTAYLETPNIDELARQSLRFSNAYAGAANCAPSRAVLISGQYGPRHGVYTVSPSTRGNPKTRKLIPVKNKRGLQSQVVTIAETLKTAGYKTGTFGKWHLGADPDLQGFDINVAGSHQGMTFHYFSPYSLPNIKDGPKGEYLTQRLTTELIDWVKAQQDAPFFAYLPYYSVHTPYQAPLESVKKYRSKGVNSKRQATYAAMVEQMDFNVGRILKMLEDERLAENTLVIFTSDNGGYRFSSFPSSLRAGKGSYYEGGIRVPLLVRWPKKIKPADSSIPVINADFYPTLKKIAHAKTPAQELDGVDLSPIFFGRNALESRDLFWHFPVYLQAHHAATDQGQDPLFRTRPGSAIRSGDWKLIQYFENNELELYNLKDDPGETVNLAKRLPGKTQALKEKLVQWQMEVGADVPTELNPEFDPAVSQQLIDEALIKRKTHDHP